MLNCYDKYGLPLAEVRCQLVVTTPDISKAISRLSKSQLKLPVASYRESSTVRNADRLAPRKPPPLGRGRRELWEKIVFLPYREAPPFRVGKASLFLIRSLTPQQSTGLALAFSVQHSQQRLLSPTISPTATPVPAYT